MCYLPPGSLPHTGCFQKKTPFFMAPGVWIDRQFPLSCHLAASFKQINTAAAFLRWHSFDRLLEFHPFAPLRCFCGAKWRCLAADDWTRALFWGRMCWGDDSRAKVQPSARSLPHTWLHGGNMHLIIPPVVARTLCGLTVYWSHRNTADGEERRNDARQTLPGKCAKPSFHGGSNCCTLLLLHSSRHLYIPPAWPPAWE